MNDEEYLDRLCNPEKYQDDKKKNKDDEHAIQTSRIQIGETLYEQIYKPGRNTSYFIGWDAINQKPIILDSYRIGKEVYYPINDDLLKNKAVLLPSNTEEYGTIETLQKDIHDFIYRYLDISDEHLQKAVWYVQLSWVLDNAQTVSYLRALGDYGTGKTRYEDVIGGICYKPMFVGGSVRSAPIYRVINQWRGTAVFDEFTLGKSDETEDIVQILNCGFQRGKPVLRCKDGNYSQVECFDPFGAKILACRKPFEDKALESRCITEIIRETDRNDIPIDLGENFYRERTLLQNKLLLYRLRNWDKIRHDENIRIDFGHIQPRIKQAYLPFTVLFEQDEKTLGEFITTVKKHNASFIEENATTIEGCIVKIYCRHKSYNRDEILTAQDIRNDLVNNEGYNPDKTNAKTVGRRLNPLGFKNKPVYIEGTTKRAVFIEPDALKRLIYRYILPEEQEEFLRLTEKKLEDF
jgi:hypothetical protein